MGSKYYVFDMDGVLVEYRRDMSPDKVEMMTKKGYFANLRPEWNMIFAMLALKARYPDRVFILTSTFASEFPYSIPEKIEYMKRLFPEMEKNFILVDAEKGETKPERFFEATGRRINKDCMLIDDYGKNLAVWKKQGGTPVKYLNLINNSHGTHYDYKLDCFMRPDEIVDRLEEIEV